MARTCGYPTRGGRGPACKKPVRGPWRCATHGGPSAEDAERRVQAQQEAERRRVHAQQLEQREQRVREAERRFREAEHAASPEAQAAYIRDLKHQVDQTSRELAFERSRREQAEQKNRELRQELISYTRSDIEGEYERYRLERKARKNRRRIWRFLVRIEPKYVELITKVIEFIRTVNDIFGG